ncbi:MAG TPA: NAD(P)(+) transhydrogenase (Re/Si-specific) subunit alpha, partial [Bacteroidia bacterium]|nr:NAD(P)(+) transhydrogenase (Re/Si-specific) subunit alpha [Bacteroidia bacterium]
MILGVPKELKNRERRVALTPDVVKSLVASGYNVVVEEGAGEASFYTNDQYKNAGATLGDKAQVYGSDVVLKVNAPQPAEIAQMKKGATLISFMWAATNADLVEACKQAGINAFSMDAIPRISRAQKMDALSSQANLAGYKAVVLCADTL